MQGTAGREKKKGEGALSNDVGKPVRSLFVQMVNFIPESRLLFIESVPFTEILSRQSLKLFLKMGLNKWNKNFRLDHSVRVSRMSFPVASSVATGNFTLERPEN